MVFSNPILSVLDTTIHQVLHRCASFVHCAAPNEEKLCYQSVLVSFIFCTSYVLHTGRGSEELGGIFP